MLGRTARYLQINSQLSMQDITSTGGIMRERSRIVLFIAVLLILATAVFAADPIIGSWKLNIAKSTFASNAPPAPKEQTEAYRYLNTGEIELTYKSIEKDGTSQFLVLTWPAQGGTVKIIKGDIPKSIAWIETLIAGEWYVTQLQDGKQAYTRHKIISKDGKILRQSFRSTDVQGKPYENILVFNRQYRQ
jgi:hypothetical protein